MMTQATVLVVARVVAAAVVVVAAAEGAVGVPSRCLQATLSAAGGEQATQFAPTTRRETF
jgi:hypothetical protein